MSIARLIDVLACPVCHGPFALDGRTLRCADGHCFDLAKQGYVNLLGRAAPRNADTPEMLEARSRFLATGAYGPIADAVAEICRDARTVLEVGAGTGHYLAQALPAGARGIATDVSAAACKRAAKAHPDIAAVVADTWERLPIADGSVDVVLCVFAPRNFDEFRRVLAPGGRVVVVVPNPAHLEELRRAHGLLDIDACKADEVAGQLETPAKIWVSYEVDLDAATATDLVAMGPNAFHGATEMPPTTVTVDVHVVVGAPKVTAAA